MNFLWIFLILVSMMTDPSSSCKFSKGKWEGCELTLDNESDFTSPGDSIIYLGPDQLIPNEDSEDSTTDSNKTGALCNRKCAIYNPISMFLEEEIIIGGKKSAPKDFKHMALIGYGDEQNVEWKCGGSLISKRFILTAAHCVAEEEPKFVRLGDLDLSTEEDDAGPQNFTITEIIKHPSYKPPSRYHDIALLELDREAELTKHVRPACLYQSKDTSQIQTLIATGWGKIGFTGESSTFLLQVDLDFVSHDSCQTAYRRIPKEKLFNGIDDNLQICAGKQKGKDTCQGDSGGPLQTKNFLRSNKYNVYDIIGVTSFGKPCGLSGQPGVYTRVSSYISWIENIAFKYE